MFKIFKSNTTVVTENEIRRRAEVNTEARRMAINISKEQVAEKAVKASKTALNKETMLQTLDSILDAVSSFDNIKISTLCELRNAIENGDGKDMIKFLKAKEKIVVKKRKKKSTWES